MKDSCKHDIKISGYDIISTKPISDKKFKCINCNKKIRLDVSKSCIVSIVFFISIIVMLFVIYPLREILSYKKSFVKYGYLILTIIGITNLYIWIINLIIWIFRKKIKYVEVDDVKKE